MPGMNTAERLATYLKDAARQRRLMEPWVEDRRFEARGGTVIYSVDSNVIGFYANPPGESPVGGNPTRQEGYAQIFLEDPEELSVALGEALAAHIFEHKSKSGLPKLVIPPLEHEVGSMFAAIARSAEKEHKNAREEVNALKEIASEIASLRSDQDAVIQRITEKAPTLTKLIQGLNSANAQMHRLGKLFSEGYVSSIDYLIESKEASRIDKDLARVLAPISKLHDLILMLTMKSAWQDRLLQTKRSNTPKSLIEGDAAALARIEWMNKVLEDRNFRFVQVTGDRALLRAASKYKIDEEHSFADLYLRHPASFLGAALASNTEIEPDSERSDLLDMLDVFLGKITTNRSRRIEQLDLIIDQNERELADIVRPVLVTHPTIVSDFREKWDAYTRSVAASYIPRALWSLDLKIPNDIESLFDSIQGQLEARIEQTWAACFGAVTRTGFDILAFQKPGQAIRPRNPPPLYFKSFPRTFEFMKTIIASQSTGRLDADVYKSALEKLMKEDQGVGYLYYLAYAFLFATAGRWHIAAILAEQALRVVDRKSGDRSLQMISGREAAYLKVVAKRHSARNPDELEQIKHDLESVYRCYDRDRRDRPDLDAWPVRFDSERIALELTHHLFAIFCNYELTPEVNSLADIQCQIIDKLQTLDVNMDPWIRCHVERNMLTNLFMIALLRRFHAGDVAVSADALTPFHKLYRDNIGRKTYPEIGTSFLVRTICEVTEWWLTPHSSQRKGLRDRILLDLSDKGIEDSIVFPYDRARFRFLRSIVEKFA